MTNIVKIENQELQVKEFNGQRVVTLKDIDRVHERESGTARKRFNDNKHYLIEGEDFFSISRKDFFEKYDIDNCVRNSDANQKMRGNPNVKMVLLTESGYLMLVKSLTDDIAWRVQRQLVNCYFKVKEEFRGKFSPKPSITFEQTIEIANVIRKTPVSSMEYVFKVLKVFVPELEMPEDESEIKRVQGSKVIKDDLNFKKQFNRYLKENNLTICDFAKKNNLAKSNVWNWATGKVTPSMRNLQIIANIIGSDVDVFL